MTSVFMIFELTQDYQVFVPLMIANMISFAISRHFQPTSLYHALLQQDGVHMPTPGNRIEAQSWSASDIMLRDISLVPPDAAATAVLEAMKKSGLDALLVGTNGRYEGIVTRDRVENVISSVGAEGGIADLVMAGCAHVHPDHSLDVVVDRLGQNPGILPVLSRIHGREVLGVITPQTVLHFLQRTWNAHPVVTTTVESRPEE